jgi:DNA repair exonuclease SbcCD ATPase subunit
VILRSIKVSKWRCFLSPVEVGPFSEGLNVLHAPNATGKSTLFEALLRALLDGHNIGGKEIKAIQPWGRSLAPMVIVEFCHKDVDYRITKQFLEKASSLLERKENGVFRPLAERNDADEMVRKFLSRSTPGRGLSQSKNWGLAQVLWAPQGNLAFGGLSGDIVDDIRSSLGAQLSVSATGPLEKLIDEHYNRIYTSGGKLKTGKDSPEMARLFDKLIASKEKRLEAVQQQQAFADSVRRIEDLREKHEQARRNQAGIKKELDIARLKLEAFKELVSKQKQQESRFNETQAQYDKMNQHIGLIKSAREEQKKAEEAIQVLERDIPLQKKEFIEMEKDAAAAKAELEDVRKVRQAVEKAQREAEQAHRFVDASKLLEERTERLEKIALARKAFDEHCRERDAVLAPDIKVLGEIRRLIRERDDASVHIKASLIILEIVPEKEGYMEVISAEETGMRSLQSGIPVQVNGSPEVVVELPGVLRLRASGPAGSIEEYRQIKAEAERSLKEFTAPFGTVDVRELEQLKEKKDSLISKVGEARVQLDTLLQGSSIEQLKEQSIKQKAIIDDIVTDYPGWKEVPPDHESLLAIAKERERLFKVRIDEAEARRDIAQAAFVTANLGKTRTVTQLEEVGKQLASAQSNISNLTIDGKTDEQREKDYKAALLAWDAARASKNEADRQLTAFGGDPADVVSTLNRQLEASTEAAKSALEQEKMEEGRLASISSRGTYSTLALVEEEVACLEEAVAEEQVKVDAIKLIHDTVEQCRAEALSAVIGPVEKRAGGILQRIAGERLGALELKDSFEPVAVFPVVTEEPIIMEGNLSGGEQEQIYLATRLALAEVLAKEERQLVVLDDVLTATDTARLARIMTILEEEAQRLQLLILTCHPERYGGLSGANFIDLAELVEKSTKA